ncbi:LacI family DNA-binding transcriptional regulator [Calidifontibacter terrae]
MAKSRRVGIRDVARAAGLSITTVSWALNDKGDVAPATRAKVQQIAAELGYQPNAAAQSLASGRSRILGVAVRHRDSTQWQQTYLPYYRSVVAGAAIEAVEHDHAVAAVPFGADGRSKSTVSIDGMIVVDPVHNDPVISQCAQLNIPVVANGRPIELHGRRVPVVQSDITAGMGLVMAALATAGAQRPALLSGADLDAYTLDTEDLYRGWCEGHGVTPLIRRVAVGESAEVAAAEVIAAGADGLHCLNETYGSAALSVKARLAPSAPDDLVITMMGEQPRAARNGAGYLVFDTIGTGAACVRSLVELIEGGDVADVVLPCQFVWSNRE